jgi:hypothetical protein
MLLIRMDTSNSDGLLPAYFTRCLAWVFGYPDHSSSWLDGGSPVRKAVLYTVTILRGRIETKRRNKKRTLNAGCDAKTGAWS